MKSFYPATGTAEEWNAAYYRLEDYLRAHLVLDKIHQSQLVLRLIQRAAVRHATNPSEPPVRMAMEEAYAEIDQWFDQFTDRTEQSPQIAAIRGRVFMYLLDAPQRWPQLFLSTDAKVPAAFENAVRGAAVPSGPDLAVSSMVPRPLDADENLVGGSESWGKFAWIWTALLILGVLGSFGGVAYWYLR